MSDENENNGADQSGNADTNKAADSNADGAANSDSLFSGIDANTDEAKQYDFSSGERPQDFPEEFWDTENKSPNVSALLKAQQEAAARADGLRKKLSTGVAPKSADEYKFEVDGDEDTKKAVAEAIPENDPVLKMFKDAALKAKMPTEQFNEVMKIMGPGIAKLAKEMIDGGPAKSDEEMAAEQKEWRDAEYKKIGDNAPAILRSCAAWVMGFEKTGLLSGAEAKGLLDSMTDGNAVRAINKLRAHYGGGATNNIPMSSQTDGLPSDAEIAGMIDKATKNNDSELYKKAEGLIAQREKAGRTGPLIKF